MGEGVEMVCEGVRLGRVEVAGEGNGIIVVGERERRGGYGGMGDMIWGDVGVVGERMGGEDMRLGGVWVEEGEMVVLEKEEEVKEVKGRLKMEWVM